MKTEFIAKAEENLKAAELLFDAGLLNASANRAYYAAYQIAIAALAHDGIKDSRQHNSHRWVAENFTKELVNQRKRYPAWTKEAFERLRRVREEADYDLAPLDRIKAKRQLEKAKEFYNLVFNIIKPIQR